jgi:hypothetical protein
MIAANKAIIGVAIPSPFSLNLSTYFRVAPPRETYHFAFWDELYEHQDLPISSTLIWPC